jgi:hypothetical protein
MHMATYVDKLPSDQHPLYIYGNPNDLKHPAARPRHHWDPMKSSRALHEDLGWTTGSTLRWKDLAFDTLIPPDPTREVQRRAAEARRMANGTASSNQTQGYPHAMPAQQAIEVEDDDMTYDDEDDEGDEYDEEDGENEEEEEDDSEDGDENEDENDENWSEY